MAGELTTTITFTDGEQVTSAKLNQIILGASFTTNAITNTTLTVTGGKLKVGTITSSEMGANSVTATAIASNAVTAAKILDGNVTTSKLANLAVTGAKIASDTITFSNLATAIAATEIAMRDQTAGYLVTPQVAKHSKSAAKAHGCFALNTGRTIQSNVFNFANAVRLSSTTSRVTFDDSMTASSYTVLATWESGSSADNQSVAIFNKNPSYFEIKHPTEANDRLINFVVFGLLA